MHTDPGDTTVGAPQAVLHQGIGTVDLMIIVIDNKKHKIVYGAPVFSHYELLVNGLNRKTDSEWERQVGNSFTGKGELIPRPEWTKEYLIRGKAARKCWS